MARSINRLSAKFVAKPDKPGRYADGGNLYLVVALGGSRSWAFLYRDGTRQREMGLGSVTAVSLARARELAAQARGLLAEGIDPLDARKKDLARADDTFAAAARDLHAAKSPGWKNAKVRVDWLPMMERYCAAIWQKPVGAITVQDVLGVLAPIWSEKAETASRVRGRMEAVLDAARVRGLMPDDRANVARWRGHLSHLLPKRQRLQRGHFAAMAYADMPKFLAAVRGRPATAARCLEFLILTGARSQEALGARWSEIDLDAGVWTIPPARMKASREHRVPLSDRALALLAEMAQLRAGADGFVFPGQKPGRSLSVMGLEMLLRRMKLDVTVHGFRSTFRDWAGEMTSFPREVAETALAHQVGNSVERAYRRGDALEKRRALMQAWADYCTGTEAQNVVPLRRASE